MTTAQQAQTHSRRARTRVGNLAASHDSPHVRRDDEKKSWPRVGDSFVFQRVSSDAFNVARHRRRRLQRQERRSERAASTCERAAKSTSPSHTTQRFTWQLPIWRSPLSPPTEHTFSTCRSPRSRRRIRVRQDRSAAQAEERRHYRPDLRASRFPIQIPVTAIRS